MVGSFSIYVSLSMISDLLEFSGEKAALCDRLYAPISDSGHIILSPLLQGCGRLSRCVVVPATQVWMQYPGPLSLFA